MRFGGFVVMVVSMLAAGLVGGCTNNKASTKAMSSIVDTRVELVKAQNDLHDTMTALENLQSASGDVRPAYKEFKKAMASTDEHKERAQQLAVDMRENSAAYQKQWQEEASKIDDPSLKSSAEERAASVRAKYDGIRALALECRKNYANFHSDLRDIDTYLAADTTMAAIEKAKPTIATARSHGDQLSSNLSMLIEKMNALTANINPKGVVPEK